MRHTGLFNGIGGFMLAAEWMGWENVDSVEIDPWCNKIIEKNFPNVNRYYDIKEYKGERGSVDILTGGFPCQPVSNAGKRKGTTDHRWLWPEYFRVIQESGATYVVGENVTGLTSLEDGKTLEGIYLDLESEGYTVESFIIPACGVEAWHKRDRIWIVAYNDIKPIQCESNSKRNSGIITIKGEGSSKFNGIHSEGDASNSKKQGLEGTITEGNTCTKGCSSKSGQRRWDPDWWSTEPGVGRVANGIPNRVDRLKGLGNAIVPQVALEIFKAIEQLDYERNINT